jgi:ribose transport system substrate-binding protein
MRSSTVACALAAIVVGTLLLTACGGHLAPAAAQRELKIGYVPKTLDQEFWVTTEKGSLAGGRDDDAEVLVQAPTSETAVDEQIAIIENLLVQEVDALIAAPADSVLLEPVLTRASEEVPVVLLDTDMPDWEGKTSYVGSDNFAAGLRAGEYIKEQLKGSGTVGIVAGIPGSVPGDQREAGMREGIKGTDIEVVQEIAADFNRLQAVGAMEDILQNHPDVDAVFATNDQMALGAIEALQTRGREDALLVGVDGAVEATQAIIGGDMDASVAQNPYEMGQVSVETAVKAVNDEPVKERINTGLTLITEENAKEYLKTAEDRLGSLPGARD